MYMQHSWGGPNTFFCIKMNFKICGRKSTNCESLDLVLLLLFDFLIFDDEEFSLILTILHEEEEIELFPYPRIKNVCSRAAYSRP